MIEKIKLVEICNPKQWKTLSTQELIENGKFPVYGANGIIGHYNSYNHEDKTVLITCRGATCGNVHISKKKSYINGNAMALDDLNEKICNKKYLYYYLKNYNMNEVISGSAQPQITIQGLKRIIVKLYNLDKQKVIVNILDKIQEIIDVRRKQIEELDEIIKSQFVEMFGNFEINDKKWNIVNFLEVASIDTNMTKDFKKYAELPHIGIENIEKNTGKLINYISVRESNLTSGKYLFDERHIIYSKIRPNLNKVATPDFKGLCSADSYPILINDRCRKEFLVFVLRSEYFLNYILSYSSRTNIPKVNKEQLGGFKIPLPPIELQNQFAEFVKQIDKQKFMIEKSLKEKEELQESLMNKYFN